MTLGTEVRKEVIINDACHDVRGAKNMWGGGNAYQWHEQGVRKKTG